MHRIDCYDDQHMHNVVGVQIEIDQAGNHFSGIRMAPMAPPTMETPS